MTLLLQGIVQINVEVTAVDDSLAGPCEVPRRMLRCSQVFKEVTVGDEALAFPVISVHMKHVKLAYEGVWGGVGMETVRKWEGETDKTYRNRDEPPALPVIPVHMKHVKLTYKVWVGQDGDRH